MRAIGAQELADLWDWGQHRPTHERAVGLLATVHRDRTPDSLAGLPLGARDGLLLEFFRDNVGPELQIEVRCPDCGDRTEMTAPCADLLLGPASLDPPQEPVVLEIDDLTLVLRLPTTNDLASAWDGVGVSRGAVLSRCLLQVARGAEETLGDALTDEERARAHAALLEADPQADLQFRLQCLVEECGRRWVATLDVAEFVWAAIERRMRALAVEVHALARAYGWTEAEVLALGPGRRELYLRMVEG